jgi:dipeptidyl aminopeptidase/acylaminoacyl peptidase
VVWNTDGEQDTVASPVELLPGLSASIRQDANQPPALIVANGTREVPLLTPDQRIDGIARARVESFEWPDVQGGVCNGGLMLPDARNGPLPLVIQIYGYHPDRFLPDGTSPTAYAAQPLTAQGFAVLQMPLSGRATYVSSDMEGTSAVSCIDGAVGYLSGKNLVDRNRVGLIGFSRGAYQVDYALTNPGSTKFAAAVSAEGFSGSYGYHLLLDLVPSNGREVGWFFRGGGSFWSNKIEWLARAPGFNLDRVQTPLLLSGGGGGIPGGGLIYDLEFYSGLEINRRPFDYLYFPNGVHPLMRPRERYASLTASVDWMNFWLKDREDPDSSKAGQYARWRELRKIQEQREKEAVSSKGLPND